MNTSIVNMFTVFISLAGFFLTVSADFNATYFNGSFARFIWYGNMTLHGDWHGPLPPEEAYYAGGSDGVEARPGEFPYMAWTKARYVRDGLLPCAGMLISPQWVITDATCVKQFDEAYGIIPVFDGISPETRNPRPKKYGVAKKIAHEGFKWTQGNKPVPGVNNIGLLQMSEAIPAAQGFTPISLPPAGAFKGQAELVMPSWGRNSKGQNHKALRYSKIEVHDLAWCKQFEQKRKQTYFKDHGDKMICNNPSQSSLSFDLSSPLVKKGADPAKDVLIGIQSLDVWSTSGEPSLTGFVDVGAHRDWIKKHTKL